MTRTRRPVTAVLALFSVALLASCESGPSGPGVMAGTATATATASQTLGAVVLEVTGSGITGFAGQGGSKAYGARLSAENGRYRVVVVGTGDLGFGVQVDDVKGPTPTVQVVSAVDANNASMPASDVQVGFPH